MFNSLIQYSVFPILFQEQSLYLRDSPHKLMLWTDTITGYQNEAEQLVQCILENHKLCPCSYWLLTIAYHQQQTAEQVKQTWTKTTRCLKRSGIVGLWIREINRKNHIHYHILVKDKNYSAEQLRSIVQEAIKQEAEHHINIVPVENLHSTARYITKARCSGVRNGRYSNDVYADKRLLFLPRLGLKKYGEISKFFIKPIQSIRKSIKRREQEIYLAKQQDAVVRQVKAVYPLVCQEFTKEQLLRRFAERWIAEQMRENESNNTLGFAERVVSQDTALEAVECTRNKDFHLCEKVARETKINQQSENQADKQEAEQQAEKQVQSRSIKEAERQAEIQVQRQEAENKSYLNSS